MAIITQPLNPWRSMWMRPRATIRQVHKTGSEHTILFLAALAGIVDSIGNASGQSAGDRIPFPAILIACLVIGGAGGILALYVGGALISWVGRKLGGRGEALHVRTALAWSAVPTVWGGLLLGPQFILFGEELFTTTTPRINANPLLALILVVCVVVETVLAVWSFVLLVVGISEVHDFSVWRSFGTLLLSFLTGAGPVLCLVAGIAAGTLLGERISTSP